MSEENNWLRDILTGINNKVENIEINQTSMIKDTQKNWDAYKGLYRTIEEHKLAKCTNLVTHENNDHVGLFGKVLGYALSILTIIGMIIAATIYIVSHIIK